MKHSKSFDYLLMLSLVIKNLYEILPQINWTNWNFNCYQWSRHIVYEVLEQMPSLTYLEVWKQCLSWGNAWEDAYYLWCSKQGVLILEDMIWERDKNEIQAILSLESRMQKGNCALFSILATVQMLDDFKGFAIKYMGLNWGQMTLNVIGGSHIAMPVKSLIKYIILIRYSFEYGS